MSSSMSSDLNATSGSSPEKQPQKKRPGACDRCRRRKVRCDGAIPTCTGCRKGGLQCSYASGQLGNVHLLEKISQLEGMIQQAKANDESFLHVDGLQSLQNNDRHGSMSNISGSHTQSANAAMDTNLARDAHSSVDIESPVMLGPQQPIAHEVGMLSLSNSSIPRYIGPSSGVTFARLIYSAAPQTQGLPASFARRVDILPDNANANGQIQSLPIPQSAELRQFIDSYFANIHPLHPFMDEEEFMIMAERVRVKQQSGELASPLSYARNPVNMSAVEAHDMVQFFLVVFLGAKWLECKQGRSRNAEGYLVSAMVRIGYLELQESVRGIQTLLLLLLSSLHSPQGLNAWFLKSTIIASCLDLGLQRKISQNAAQTARARSKEHGTRSGIFWSAYSLDRTLTVILGRPLTLRDEAIDIQYPDGIESTEVEHDATNMFHQTEVESDEPSAKRTRLELPPSSPATFSFRFDRLVAEIKLMLYRVAQSPARFPWPTNLISWQTEVHNTCSKLLSSMTSEFDRLDIPYRSRANLSIMAIHIELKYHHTIMLLYRPSPGIPRPSALALRFCFESAMETIRLHTELHRLNSHPNTWIDAHTIFISGITVCYCLWVSSNIRQVTPFRLFSLYADMVKQLLTSLSKTWAIATGACEKFDTLAASTKAEFRDKMMSDDEDGLTLPVGETQSPAWPAMPQADFDLGAEIDWTNLSVEYDIMDLLPDDLPEIPDWFALSEWLDDGAQTQNV